MASGSRIEALNKTGYVGYVPPSWWLVTRRPPMPSPLRDRPPVWRPLVCLMRFAALEATVGKCQMNHPGRLRVVCFQGIQ